MPSDAFGPIPFPSDFVITHIFDAPRTRVWDAWTMPDHLSHWWGQPAAKVLTADVSLRLGGHFRYSFQTAGGVMTSAQWTYRLIDAPKRLVFVKAVTDPAEPATLFSITLEEQGDRTLLTLIARPENATAPEQQAFRDRRTHMKQDFTSSFAALASYLAETQSPG